MKPIILTAGSVLWTILFYEQEIGLNVFLFSILIVIGWWLTGKENLKGKVNLTFTAGLLISGFFVLYYGAAFPMIMFVLSLFFISTIRYSEKVSLITRPVFLFLATPYSWLVSWQQKLDMPVEGPSREVEIRETGKFTDYIKYAYWIIFSIIIILLFFFLYRDSNRIFYELTRNIQMEISPEPVFFTIFGAVVLYHIFYSVVLDKWAKYETSLPDHHTGSPDMGDVYIRSRNRILTVLLVILNILLLSTNLIDIFYLTGTMPLPANLTHSEIVHDAVGSVIVSIVIAMILILILYSRKQNLNLITKPMLWVTYLWIIQNFILVITTLGKNYEYIAIHDLTYKRIGVMVYLLLSVIGLWFVFFKVKDKKSNWYVLRKTSSAFYIVLLFLSVFNWPVIVTQYNLNSGLEKGKVDDITYLIGLDDRNIQLLKTFSEEHPELLNEYDRKIIEARADEIKDRSVTWQSFTISNYLVKTKLE